MEFQLEGPRRYCVAQGVLFAKRSDDPTIGDIVRSKPRPGKVVRTTGKSWRGPNGGLWAEFDAQAGEKPGWVLVEGPGFKLDGPALVEAPVSSVYALSDLHTDFPQNLSVLSTIPRYPDDAVILAGDISHDLTTLRKTFEIFVERFRHVFFCPGNHDLWLHRSDGCTDSLMKLSKVLALCEELGVHTKPKIVGDGILVVPLLSWYERGFDVEPDVEHEEVLPVEQTMTDFHTCKWPEGLSPADASLAEHFDRLNGELPERGRREECRVVLSFSHFLPRPELLPEKRFLFYPNLPKASGSRPLGTRVQELQPHCHIFGHSHYGWDAEVEGIRYLQAAVAYPRERDSRGFALRLCEGGAGFVGGEVPGGITVPTLVYDAATDELPRWSGFWSGHYDRHSRQPEDVRWIYRPPRSKERVGSALKVLVDAGEPVDDDAIVRQVQQASITQ